jgi:hypothetical protein
MTTGSGHGYLAKETWKVYAKQEVKIRYRVDMIPQLEQMFK